MQIQILKINFANFLVIEQRVSQSGQWKRKGGLKIGHGKKNSVPKLAVEGKIGLQFCDRIKRGFKNGHSNLFVQPYLRSKSCIHPELAVFIGFKWGLWDFHFTLFIQLISNKIIIWRHPLMWICEVFVTICLSCRSMIVFSQLWGIFLLMLMF